jgi:hypothetical protein
VTGHFSRDPDLGKTAPSAKEFMAAHASFATQYYYYYHYYYYCYYYYY